MTHLTRFACRRTALAAIFLIVALIGSATSARAECQVKPPFADPRAASNVWLAFNGYDGSDLHRKILDAVVYAAGQYNTLNSSIHYDLDGTLLPTWTTTVFLDRGDDTTGTSTPPCDNTTGPSTPPCEGRTDMVVPGNIRIYYGNSRVIAVGEACEADEAGEACEAGINELRALAMHELGHTWGFYGHSRVDYPQTTSCSPAVLCSVMKGDPMTTPVTSFAGTGERCTLETNYPPAFRDLSASLGCNATFSFSYAGPATEFVVEVGTSEDMATAISFASGASSPITVADAVAQWSEYRHGQPLWFRVKTVDGSVVSPVQYAGVVNCPPPPVFSNLSASLSCNPTFNFSYSGTASLFVVDVGISEDMVTRPYLSFGSGASSPIAVADAVTRWTEYRHGQPLWFRVKTADGSVVSPIQYAGVVNCPPVFSNLSASLSCNPSFNFSYSGTASQFVVDVGITYDLTTRPYLSFGSGASSPITVADAVTRWTEYRHGQPLWFRVKTVDGSVVSPIQYAGTVNCPQFSNLSASLGCNPTFSFSYSGTASQFVVDVGITYDMATRPYLSFGSGASSPIAVANAVTRWTEYRHGTPLWFRVKTADGSVVSPVQYAGVVNCPPVFSNLSASLGCNPTFNFSYAGASSSYIVDLGLAQDMVVGTYLSFGSGASSPITVTNPTKWDKYLHGTQMWFRVKTADGSVVSPILSAGTINCPSATPPTFSNLSASLGCTPTFNFSYSGASSNYIVDLGLASDMVIGTYLSFGSGASSPVSVTNPTKWDKYQHGTPMWFRVKNANGSVVSPIKFAGAVNCVGAAPVFTSSAASLGCSSTFSFSYTGNSPSYSVDLSLTNNFSSGVYLNFGTGTTSPIVVSGPGTRWWNAYTQGRTLYYRINNSDRTKGIAGSAVVSCASETLGTFTSVGGSLGCTPSFNFAYSGYSPSYRVDLSLTSNFSSGVYLDFGSGASSPIGVLNPKTKWSSYTHGRRLYWRVWNAARSRVSGAGTALVTCPGL